MDELFDMTLHVSQSERLHATQQTFLRAFILTFPKEVLKLRSDAVRLWKRKKIGGSAANVLLKRSVCFTIVLNETPSSRSTLNKTLDIVHEGSHKT